MESTQACVCVFSRVQLGITPCMRKNEMTLPNFAKLAVPVHLMRYVFLINVTVLGDAFTMSALQTFSLLRKIILKRFFIASHLR